MVCRNEKYCLKRNCLSVLVVIYKSLTNYILFIAVESGAILRRSGDARFTNYKIELRGLLQGPDYNVRSAQIFNPLNWDNLEKIRSQQFGLYKTINKMVPDYLSSKFTPTNVMHNYNLCHSDSKLFAPLTESLKKGFTYSLYLSKL
jgi:hypothetical protein